jgi:hypothetical protein
MRAPVGYEAMNLLAQYLRKPLHTLMALSHGADPFTCGTPAHRAWAQWFADLWQEHMPPGGHLRRLHYRLISQRAPVPMVGGERYENTVNCWTALKLAGKWARVLGLVDADDMDDKRPADRAFYLPHDAKDAGLELLAHEFWAGGVEISKPHFPDPPELRLHPPRVPQRYHLEVWVEKSDVEDVVRPIVSRYGANYCAFAGQPGFKPCRELVERAERSGRPVRILYISDFDPQGQSMPVAVARKVEFILVERELDLDVELRPLALTKEQCIRLKLPRIPIKEGDRGKAAFEERHGDGATELDALEALHPGELRSLIMAEVERYHDPTLQSRVDESFQELRDQLKELNEAVVLRNELQLADLRAELKAITKQLDAIREQIVPIRQQAEDWWTRAEPLYQAMAEELREAAPDLDDIEWPEPLDGDEHPDPLFDSTRSYLDQMAVYKRFQDKPTDRRPRRKRNGGEP